MVKITVYVEVHLRLSLVCGSSLESRLLTILYFQEVPNQTGRTLRRGLSPLGSRETHTDILR